jgi:glutamine amidotransferase
VRGTDHVPVIGWCRVRQTHESPLWAGIEDGAYFYFVHSYAPAASDCAVGVSDHVAAAAACQGTVMGTQFHPEKSGPDGLHIYANFVGLCRD